MEVLEKMHETSTSRTNHESEVLLKELIAFPRHNVSDEVLFEVYKAEAQFFNHLLYSDEARMAIDSAMFYAKKLGDRRKEASCHLIMAYIIKDFHSHNVNSGDLQYLDNVNEHFLKAKEVFKELRDTSGLLSALMGSSFTRFEKGDFAVGKSIVLEMIELNTPIKSKHIQMRLLSELGTIHDHEGDFDLAREKFREALVVAGELKDERIKQYNYFLLADLDIKQERFEDAMKNILLAEEIGEIAKLNDIAHYKYRIYKELGKHELALLEHEKYFQTYVDAKFNRDTENINKWDAELRNKFMDEDLLRKQEELKAQSLRTKIFIGLSLLSLLAIGFLLFLYNRINKVRYRLAKQYATIQRQKKELTELDEMKSRFFANISHELRTPLTLMLGPIDAVINRKQLETKDVNYLKLAQENGNKLLRMVASILNLSKIESGKIEVHEVPVNLYEFIRRIFSAFDSYAQQENLQLLFDFRASRDVNLLLDIEKMEIILNNLISNAIKFSNSNTTISLIVEDVKNSIKIQLTDEGKGIHPEDLPYIFDRFYQSKQEGSYVDGGSGVGLALSKELIELLRGTIVATSVMGKGSKFVVSFPRKEILGSQVVENNKPLFSNNRGETVKDIMLGKPIGSLKEKTLLVVEDNPSLREFLKSILGEDYNIITAPNGQVALDVLLEIKNEGRANPDLILTDIMMPVMDGYQLLKKIKTDERFSWIPTIALTARADRKDMLQALRIGVDDYVLKPFDEKELATRIENLINFSEQKQSFVKKEKINNSGAPKISLEDQEWLLNFENFTRGQIKNTQLSVSWIAHEFAFSESTLLRQLKRLTGHSPSKYIQEMRLNAAKDLLEERKYNSVSKVAYEVGYKDAGTFSRAFKSRFGKSPSSYFL